MNEQVPELERRLAEVEAELARTKAERDEYKQSMYSVLDQLMPYDPPTPEEIHDMRHGPRGPSLLEIAAELRRLCAADAGRRTL